MAVATTQADVTGGPGRVRRTGLGTLFGLPSHAPRSRSRSGSMLVRALLAGVCAWSAVASAQDAALDLRLADWLQRLRQDNAALQSARLDTEIERTAVARAQSAFQPRVRWSGHNASDAQGNTYEQQLARSDLPDYWRKGLDVQASLTGLLPSGAQWEAQAGLSRFDTNIDQLEPTRPLGAKENRATWSLRLTQPLLKDAGTAVTGARLRVAELDSEAALAREQRAITEGLAQGWSAYYDLALAHRQLDIAQAKLDTAQALQAQAQSLADKGVIAPAEVWALSNAVDRYRAELDQQSQAWLEASNRLKSLVGLSSLDDARLWRAADALPEVPEVEVLADADDAQGMAQALKQRGDLRALRLAEQREQVQLMYARNQNQARVDLVAQYGRNKLAWSGRQSLQGMDTPSWRVGVEVDMPLGQDQRGQADVAAAQARVEQAAWRTRELQAQIINEVNSALALKRSAAARYHQWGMVVAREQQAVALEQKRLRLGRTSARDVLRRQEQLLEAQKRQAEQQVAYAQADVLLAAAQGALLARLEG